MKLFGKYEIRKASKKEINSVTAMSTGGMGSVLYSYSTPMLLSAVYRCVDVISDSLAQLPFETYKMDSEGFKSPYFEHPAYSLLNLEPNENMTRFIFFKTMVSSVLLKGNAFSYIERDSRGRPSQLVYIPANYVSIEWVLINGIQRKRYRVVGFTDLVEPKDMIHILNFSYDGIIGVSTLSHARNTLDIAANSESHASGFFKGGANAAGVLTIEGRTSAQQREENYKRWDERTDPVTGKPNSIVILDGNMTYQPITISPKDSQLLETRQFNVIDICRFFSVSPVKAFDLSKASYATVEATQLAFLTDTMAPMLAKFELEFQRKLFLPSERSKIKCEFNTNGFLRADKTAQAQYLKAMFDCGGITPNEIRRENNYPRVEGGDYAFVPMNIQTVKQATTIVSDNNNVNNKSTE